MRNPIRGLLAALMLALLPFAANAGLIVGVSVNIAPPVLPVYVQPEIPALGYIWTPGYWAWGPAGYYWVPGTWVEPPSVGLLWTPGYWGWQSGAYFWHAGYWGAHVGFYGGVNYGFGYGGVGYEGGYWRGTQFFYNRAVCNVRNINVTNVYSRPIEYRGPATRVSFNGGAGGIMARPSERELAAARERHVAFTSEQRTQENMARGNEAMRASVNGGRPAIAATARPGAFSGHGVVAAREPGASGAYHAGAPQLHSDRPAQATASHPPGGYPQSSASHPQAGYPTAGASHLPAGHPQASASHPQTASVSHPSAQSPAYHPQAGYPQASAPHPQGRDPQGSGQPGGHDHEGRGRR